MFQQRPMSPMHKRGPFPQHHGRMPMGQQPFQGPFMKSHYHPQMPARGGGLKGLLTRLTGSHGNAKGQQGFIPGSVPHRAAGGMQGITDPANISNMLSNVQRALGMAQQVTPMIQQYGPLMKNLPAMIKIYRELKNGDDGESIVEDKNEEVQASTPPEVSQKHKPEEEAEEKPQSRSRPRPSLPKGSKPKIYI